MHSVLVDINHSFMEVSVGGLRDLCAPSFPFSHPDHRTIFRRGDRRGAGGERGGKGGAGFPIISDSGESPRQWGRHSLWLVLESAGGLTQADRDVAILLKVYK